MATKSKQELIGLVMQSGEQLGVESVAFHSAAADKLGLDASSMKAIALLRRQSPMTTGGIARHTNLTPGAVTALVDRLVAKGFAQRVKDPADARKIRVELVAAMVAQIDAAYEPMVTAVANLLDTLSPAELQTILTYQQKMSAVMREQAVRLRTSA